MTDRELLQDCQAKLAALSPRVDALEATASGAVSHDEVQSVVDTEASLENRVSALEKIFTTTDSAPPVTEPVVVTAEPAPTTDTAPDTSHTIS